MGPLARLDHPVAHPSHAACVLRVVRQNHRMIWVDACNPALAHRDLVGRMRLEIGWDAAGTSARWIIPALTRARASFTTAKRGARSAGTREPNNEPHELPIKIPATNTSTPPTTT
jgi:hypothetical protein